MRGEAIGTSKHEIMNRKSIILFLSLAVTATAHALPRSQQQILNIAAKAFSDNRLPFLRHVQSGDLAHLRVLYETSELSLVGTNNRGFVIVSKDDIYTPMLGYSTNWTDNYTENDGLMWWLATATRNLSEYKANHKTAESSSLTPAQLGYKAYVDALISCKWDQGTPYNNQTPLFATADGSFVHPLTGCVATAMSQVMYSHKYPTSVHGQIYYKMKQGDNGEYRTFSKDLDGKAIDYTNMIDAYDEGTYSKKQGNAVAALMAYAGLTVNMQYSTTFSGAYSTDAALALQKNFGYENTDYYFRMEVEDDWWKKKVYEAINNGNPIIYGAVDAKGHGGHCFVLDGYDANGFVHVNWGWSGSEDGYYDINVLNPGTLSSYQFSEQQEMVIADYNHQRPDTVIIKVTEPGKLSELLPTEGRYDIRDLKVIGNINGSDIRTLRELMGKTIDDVKTNGMLKHLDLSEASIVTGGDAYAYSLNGKPLYVDKDNKLPRYAFYYLPNITSIRLPENLKEIGDSAMAFSYNITSVNIPGSTTKIGSGVFYYNLAMRDVYCKAMAPVELADSTFKDINHTDNKVVSLCRLHVPQGTKEIFQANDLWNDFLEIVDDQPVPTDVRIIKDKKSNKDIYTLGGIKVVNSNGIRGIYISDGKKMLK